jgi:hypothetical protein
VKTQHFGPYDGLLVRRIAHDGCPTAFSSVESHTMVVRRTSSPSNRTRWLSDGLLVRRSAHDACTTDFSSVAAHTMVVRRTRSPSYRQPLHQSHVESIRMSDGLEVRRTVTLFIRVKSNRSERPTDFSSVAAHTMPLRRTRSPSYKPCSQDSDNPRPSTSRF